jgi:hypothetical protein
VENQGEKPRPKAPAKRGKLESDREARLAAALRANLKRRKAADREKPD